MVVVLEQFEVLKRTGVDRSGAVVCYLPPLLSDKLLSREAIMRLESDLTTQVIQTFTDKRRPYIHTPLF
jgi:hypothetical protein